MGLVSDDLTLPTNRRMRRGAAGRTPVVDAPGDPFAETDEQHEVRRAPGRVKRARSKEAAKPATRPTELWAHLRFAAGIVVVIATSIGVAWGIRHHVMSSPRFAVRTIRVEGTTKRSPEQLAAASGILIGPNIFGLDLESARLRILQDPWIEKAAVKRKLPSTVVIEVAEREAAGVVVVGSDLYLCTHDGEIFKRVEPGDPSGVVVITGLRPEQLALDRGAAVRRVRSALDLLAEYERRGPAKRLPVEEIHLGEEGTISMIVGKEPVVLELGQAPYRQKIQRAARVLEEVERRHASPGVVFLDNEGHPDRVVVRMR